MNQDRIRNFCIVAHIDHGKSTLADRLIEKTGTVDKRDMSSQLLDSMELEKERGITIKLTPTRMKYSYKGQEYILNHIDGFQVFITCCEATAIRQLSGGRVFRVERGAVTQVD